MTSSSTRAVYRGPWTACLGSGYLPSDPKGVVFGDYFYVDAPGDHAQGFEAAPIVADGELRDGFGDTFYNSGQL